MGKYNNPTPLAVQMQPAILKHGKPSGLVIINRGNGAGWALPGGYVEAPRDKSVEYAAAREFREETGFFVEPGLLSSSTITASGKLLLFVKGFVPLFLPNLSSWKPTAEAKAIRIAFKPEELCFPAHTEAMQNWFQVDRSFR